MKELLSEGLITKREFKKYTSQGLLRHYIDVGKVEPPPHLVKQRIIARYGSEYSLRTFIETGTYKGEMIEAQLKNFDSFYSIEIDGALFEKAKNKFVNYDNVNLFYGDSGSSLKPIVKAIKHPALFWLDGHYSPNDKVKGAKACPIIDELSCIKDNLKFYPSVLLIDDARLFVGKNDYPTTHQLEWYLNDFFIVESFELKYDIFRVVVVNQRP